MAHGVGYKKDAMSFKERQKEKSTNYGNKEEERGIKGTEQETAKANGEINEGEVTRKNHKGDGVITQGTKSNKVDEAATKKYKERLERYNNYVE